LAAGDAVIIILGSQVPDEHLAELAADGVSYIVCPSPDLDLTYALALLREKFGIEHLLLEGGAHTNAAFFEAGLVDEVSLVLFPAIGGRTGAANLFDAGPDGLSDALRLTTTSCKMRDHGVVHLRYKVEYPQ
jgi:riboflavin biosynthesis pyrimidine reductase